MDLTTLSNEELLKLSEQTQAPAPNPVSAAPAWDLSKFSDADLLKLHEATPSADVTDYPAAGMAGDGAAAIGRGIINGIPVIGPSITGGLNKGIAAVRSYQSGQPYADELKRVEAFGQGTAKANPWSTTAGEVAGGALGTLPLVAAAPAAFGAGTASVPVRALASAFSGAALNSADSAARTGGDVDAALKAGALGYVGGLGSPFLGQAVGRTAGLLSEHLLARNAKVPGLGNSAAGKLTDDLRNAGGLDAVRGNLNNLGPEAMLLDASPSFEGRAQGLAVLPDTRETIMNPLVARAQGANARLADDVGRNLGPATDPAAFHAGIDTAYQREIPPLYRNALSQRVEVDTSGVLNTIGQMGAQEKGGAEAALRRAWGLLHTEGDVPGVGRAMIPDRRPEALHNAKEALDAMIATVQNQQGSAAGSELRALSATRAQLNDALQAQVPGYEQANRNAELFFRQRDAFDNGQTLLNSGREAARPAQLAAETAAMAQPVQDAQRLGLRAEVDRLVGTTANDRVALQKAIKGEGDYNRARLGTVFGEEPTANVIGAVEREAAFDGTRNRIVDNSMTEMRRQSAADVAPRDLKPKASDVMPAVAGIVGGPQAGAMAYGVKGLQLGANAAGRAADVARNRELAQALVYTGDPMDTLLNALGMRLNASQRAGGIDALVNSLTQSLTQSQGERFRPALPAAIPSRLWR
ncbi:hypothetical protein FPV16_17925 [Methylobacterium sp. W2]|uniref:hypothetical protein n=1 Tax=Methylobacterium sp. W2 TaxID=2598107 RepID=UPI001D0C99C3|nr:hypothetical protein [Methylobacterium sp. W2]MCC0808066.1 hypothetical protein [Methylobacterium sp. W2]